MKLIFLFPILFLICQNSYGQSRYELPKGYKVFKDMDDKQVRIDKDFDNDGVNDLAIMASKSNDEENNYFFIFLNKDYTLKAIYYYFPISLSLGYDIKFENFVLSIGGCFGNGRYCETYKFKYYSNLMNMRLIGYDEESFGNAIHDGAYTKSINLLTGNFELEQHYFNVKLDKDISTNNVKKKITIPLITLKSLDEKTLTYLHEVGSNYFKNE